ncbi:MAG: phosphate acetyltransferase [Thermodesulfobacteria bacterium]|nr:phosphate acetyltransferase [Thermodesulfobacteriota bacterium]
MSKEHKPKSIYITSLEPRAGKLMVTLGMMELISREVSKVGFFRPVIRSEHDIDNDLNLILTRYNLDISYDDAHVFKVDEVQALGAEGRFKEIVQAILEKYNRIKGNYEFIIIEGFESSGISAGFDVDANINIAKNLGAGLIGVISGRGQKYKEILEEVKITAETIKSEGCFHLATVVNRVSQDCLERLEAAFKEPSKDKDSAPVYVIPDVKELASPTVGEIMEELDCKFIYGQKEGLNRIATQYKVAAMTLDNYLSYIENGDLIITPGDREDIVVGTLSTIFSKAFPNIAGILLTGGLLPGRRVRQLIDGMRNRVIPIISVESDTFTAAMHASQVEPQIRPDIPKKIELALGVFEARVNIDEIKERLNLSTSEIVTPLMFEFRLFEWAKKDKKRILLPESYDERILKAAEILRTRDVVDIVMLGKRDDVLERASIIGVELPDVEIIDHTTSPYLPQFIEQFYELRKHKGITKDAAKDAMLDINYFGTMMVYNDFVDGMVSGAAHATQDVLRPAFQIIRTKPGVLIASSVFFMCLPTKVMVFGDCAVNPDPNAQELATIAISSADTAAAFGIEPIVAMLSYSTGQSGKGKDVEKVAEAVRIAKQLRPDLLLDGPLQYDAAVDMEVAKKKAPDSPVAGRATVLIFPDLNTGNNTYKAVQRSSGAIAIGPVVQGLNKPVNDLSRGCLVEDVANTVAITAIQAMQN